MMTTITLGELLLKVSGGLWRNDRGNGSAGPAYVGERHDLSEEALEETVYLVTESEDPEAWLLAREALDLDKGDPEYVAIDNPGAQPSEYCAVYAG